MNPNYPSYPPQPMPGAQPYPQYPSANSQPSPYPPSQPGFNASGYPPQPQPGGYPPQPQPGGYPSQPTGQPQPGGFYPPAGGPPQPGTYAPQYGYPSQPASYPPSQPASYPSSASSFALPPQQQAYPSHVASSTWEKPSYPSSAQSGYHPPPNPSYQPSSYPSQGYAPTNIHQSGGHQEQLIPTVRPASPFDPRADAEVLRKAMERFGTDEQAIIDVLTRRSNSQRQEIAVQFKGMYGKDLIENLKSELSGKFEDLIVALMTPLPVYLANEVQHAIKGIGTNEQTLIEILCSATNAEIFAIKNAYTRVFGRSLENELAADTSGHFKRLLVSVVQGCRNESPMVDDAAVGRDAQALLSAGVQKFGTDESTFNAILCSRSYPQLRRIMAEYQRLSGKSLEQAIRSEFSGDIQEGLLAIVQCANDRATYFAGRLRDAVACVGTKDRQLIRVVVSRCEIDMQNIKRAYQQCFNQSVETDITNDTSGYYKKALLALVSG